MSRKQEKCDATLKTETPKQSTGVLHFDFKPHRSENEIEKKVVPHEQKREPVCFLKRKASFQQQKQFHLYNQKKQKTMADVTFRVKAHSENPTKTVAKARGFEMVIDEPVEMGGTNAGPNPIEYLLATLAGCLNVMSHVIAKEMNMQLNGVEIHVSGTLNTDKFSGVETDERAGLKQINAEIIPDTDADEATLEKWLKTIESRCPVNDNLSNPTPVNIKVKKKG
jgi:uncharacterized OsmC-like protein